MRRGVLPALALAAIAGCGTTAKQIGSKAAEGALESIQQKQQERPESEKGALAERAGGRAVQGAVQELTRPENVDRLSAALQQGVASTLERLATPQAPEGGGGSGAPPVAELAREVGRSVSAGVVDELWSRLHWPLLAAAFILGLLLAEIVRQMARLAGASFRRARGHR